ncbi:hypothetical protein Tco_1055506 [Tanacetum coccineum]|uniref:Reverse transcriptase domain-containing protein n=1 Tax=Tanacetum coccineum TaxID=301880 RepID=A0ABQ5H137_9ASTR
MKDLVENKPRTKEDEGNRMNPRCSALLQNIYPLRNKIQEVSFSLVPFRKLDFNNALADLGASINLMPLSQYFLILDMVEDLRMPIILGRPLLATAHAKVDIFRKSISLEVGSEKVIFKMRSSFTMTFESVRSIRSDTCPEDDDFKKIDYDLFLYDLESLKRYWESINDSKREELEWENLSLNDWMKIRYGKTPEECREDKANAIIRAIHDKLNDDWFNNTSEDENDLEGILDYFEPRSYDEFIDWDDEAYNKRRCKLLGMTYEEPTLILIKKAKVTRYTIGLSEIYTKVKVLGFDEIPRTKDNVVAMRARLMEKIAHEGNGQAKTKFSS